MKTKFALLAFCVLSDAWAVVDRVSNLTADPLYATIGYTDGGGVYLVGPWTVVVPVGQNVDFTRPTLETIGGIGWDVTDWPFGSNGNATGEVGIGATEGVQLATIIYSGSNYVGVFPLSADLAGSAAAHVAVSVENVEKAFLVGFGFLITAFGVIFIARATKAGLGVDGI